jgi:hypothetical protein
LKEDRFACFVVGDVRAKKDSITTLSDTIQPLKMLEWNTTKSLVNVVGSLAVRATSIQWQVGKMHQNVLVFYKGNPKKNKGELS